MRRSPIRSRRATPRRRTAPRWSPAEWEEANAALQQRSGLRCECCGQPAVTDVERHHRQRRRDGGDRLSNILWLTREHHAHWTAHPADAIERGIIVPTYADPATKPVLWRGTELVLLDDDGGVRSVGRNEDM